MPVLISPSGQPYLFLPFDEPGRAIAMRCTDIPNKYGAQITYEASLHVLIEDKWRSCTAVLEGYMPDADADFAGVFRLRQTENGNVECTLNGEPFGTTNYYHFHRIVMDLAKAHEAWEPTEAPGPSDLDPFG